MRIVVCVKHVPDVQSDRALSDDGLLVRGDDDVLNELDENAVEAAVSLVEEYGGEVVAVTMGPDDAVDGLRRALALGADRGIHVCDDRAAGSDVVGTARVLAAAINSIADESGPVDLVITGMAALDGMTAMVPAALARFLDLPALTLAHRVESTPTSIRIERTAGEVTETLEADLPLLLSVTDQANEARFPNFKALMAAKKKPITELDLDDLGLADHVASIGLAGAGARVDNAAQAPAREAGTIVTDSGNGGTQLAAYLTSVLGK